MKLNGPRILLRQWINSDYERFAELNGDPETMRYFPQTATRKESFTAADKIRSHIDTHGWGLWAVEVEGRFAGFTGFMTQPYDAHFTPAKEIGWRFRKEFWGHGYATEAAKVATIHAFENLKWNEIVSLTTYQNVPSQRVMQRLGMTTDKADDFYHPKVPKGHPLQLHCLYRMKNTLTIRESICKDLGKPGSPD